METESALTQDDERDALVGRLREIFVTARDRFRAAQEKSGLAASQVWALSAVLEKPGISVTDLGAVLGLHQSTTSNLLRPLVADGLLLAKATEQDRRVTQLTLTPAGRRMLRRTPTPFTGTLSAAVRTLDPTTVRRLQRDLDKLVLAMRRA